MIIEDLTGKQFEHLLVLERDRTRKNRAYWKCQCSCGKIISVSGTKLRNGQKSCGCLNKSQLKNQRFGRLIALNPTELRSSGGTILWKCQCDCGNSVNVRADALISGKTQSCGCLRTEQNLINLQHSITNLQGKKYGKLLVLEYDEIRSKQTQRSYWKCQCDCGNVISVRCDHLNGQTIGSCGCIKQSAGESIIECILQQNNLNYQKEYSFSDLRVSLPLRFDFALFDKENQLVCLIEFDGMQHYIETNYYFQDTLTSIQYRDNMKNKYCLQNKIPLFRISYKSLSQLHNIYDILNITNLYKGDNSDG